MPEEQVKMLGKFGDQTDKWPNRFVDQKFWVMNDGSIILVAWEHSDTSNHADVDVRNLLKSGAVRGQVVTDYRGISLLAVEMWKKLTDNQIGVLKRMSAKHTIRLLIVDDTWSEKDNGYEVNVRSPDEVEHILRYGPVEEATLGDIHRKQRSVSMLFPTFDDRVKNVQLMGGVRLKDMDDDNWHFEVHSGTKKDVWYDCTLHFKDIQDQLERLVKDRRLWVEDRSRVDLRKLAAAFIEKVNVQVFCSCPAFLYYGSSYILGRPKYDAKYTDPENRPPRHRNPKQYGAVCKHYQNVLKALPFYTGTIAKWLRDVYARDIAGYQKEAMRDFGWLQKAAGALSRRKSNVEKPDDEKRRRRPSRRKPGWEEPETKPTDQTQPEDMGNTPEDVPENESRLHEEIKEIKEVPRPDKGSDRQPARSFRTARRYETVNQEQMVAQYGEWTDELDEESYWLFTDGTAVSVVTFEAAAKDVNMSVQALRRTGAFTVQVDAPSGRIDLCGIRKPSLEQTAWLIKLIMANDIESVEVENGSTATGDDFDGDGDPEQIMKGVADFFSRKRPSEDDFLESRQ